MDDRIPTSYKEDIHQFSVAINNAFYMENKWILQDLFEKSLVAKHGNYSIFDIQFEILKEIIAVDSARRKFKKQKESYARTMADLKAGNASVERIKLAQDQLQLIDHSIIAAILLMGQLRSIGDGIAWWFLKYDRALLRLLAEHDYVTPPRVGKGLHTEIQRCAELASQGRPFLLNSITNFLRYGDITVYDTTKGTYELIEVKSGTSRTTRTFNQGRQLALVQEAVKTGTHSKFGFTLTKIACKSPLLTYVKMLERVLEEATANYVSSRVFGDYLSFCVFYTKKIIGLPELQSKAMAEEVIRRSLSVFKTKRDVPLPIMTNILPTVHFSRVLAPYTIFPIRSDLRFALMTGEFGILIQLNITGFERWLQKRGWTTKYIEPPKNLSLKNMPMHIPILQVFNKNIRKGTEIGIDTLTVAQMELWMPESIERIILTIMDQWPTTQYQYYTNYFPNTGKYAWD